MSARLSLSSVSRRAMLAAVSSLCVVSALSGAPVFAQTSYPSRPVTLVVPFPPGGSADTIGRLVAQRLSQALGQTVVVDNRPGAGTIIGAQAVANAPADGHTLLISSGSTFTVNPALRKDLPYDPIKSFEPIGIVGRIPLIVLANKDVPVNNVRQFVDAIRSTPDKYSYASFGVGTTSQFTAEIMLHAVGARIMHVPYRGSGPAMADLMGGMVPFSVDTVTAALPQLRGGNVKAIAVTTAKRSTLLPDVPTFAEAGYPDVDADTWIALVAPKGTPADVITKLERTLAGIVGSEEGKAALLAQGAEPAFAGPSETAAQIARELPLMRAVVQRANIQAN